MSRLLPTLHRNLLLALAYLAVGKLSLLLAIPPGFATPVWPSAGIALAAVLIYGLAVLPGVFLGSLAINLLISLDASTNFGSLQPILVAAGIAFGATLQAAVAAKIIQQRISPRAPVGNPQDVFVILLVGGALGSLINALIGPLTLLSAGLIPAGIFWLSAYTWWVGDAIGVVLFTPLLLLIANKRVTIVRKFTVAIPTLALSCLTAILFFSAKTNKLERLQNAFDTQSETIAADFRQELNAYLDILTATENFAAATEQISFKAFRSFTREFIRKYPGIQSLAWLPRIRSAERDAFEKAMHNEGFVDYAIYDRISLGTIQSSSLRDEYFPVAYSVPYASNEAASGLDTFGPDGVIGLVRQQALIRARDEGRAITTGPLSLVQAENETGLIVYNPVYRSRSTDELVSERRESLMGFTAGVFLVTPMLRQTVERASLAGMDLQLRETNTHSSPRQIYDSRSSSRSRDSSNPPGADSALRTTISIPFAGHSWELRFVQKPEAVVSDQSWELWYLLISGLLLSALFGAFLIVLSGNNDSANQHALTEESRRPALGASIAVGAVVFLVINLVIQHLQSQETQKNQSVLNDKMGLISQGISAQVHKALLALRRMAQRSEAAGGTPQTQWEKDAHHYVNDMDALLGVFYLNADHSQRWGFQASKTNTADIRSQLRRNIEELPSLLSANKSVAISTPSQPPHDSSLVTAFTPIVINNVLEGFIAGVFDARVFLDNLLLDSHERRFHIRILDDGQTLMGDQPMDLSRNELGLERTINIFNRTWTIQIVVPSAAGETASSLLPRLLFFSGILLAILASFVVYVATVANQRSLQLRRKSQELHRSEERINLILDNAGEGIYGLDTQGCTTFANKAAVQILGYSVEEMLRVSQHDLIHHSTMDGSPISRYKCKIYAAFKDGQIHSDDSEVFWHKDGYAVPVEYTSAPLRDEHGVIVGAVVVFKDITQRKKAENELLAANSELEEFAYRTSHDLRSPLVSSIELLNLAREFFEQKNAEQANNSLAMAQKSLHKLDVLVQDILALTRTKSVFEEERPVDISALVESSLQKLGHLPGFASVAIETDINLAEPISLKESRMAVIAENLISNAIKYQDQQTGSPMLRIAASAEDGVFEFRVEDNGLGIPEEQRDSLFSMFKRYHVQVSFGSGLGLYMVKKSAEILGGDIRYEPREKGSCFRFRMPINPASAFS